MGNSNATSSSSFCLGDLLSPDASAGCIFWLDAAASPVNGSAVALRSQQAHLFQIEEDLLSRMDLQYQGLAFSDWRLQYIHSGLQFRSRSLRDRLFSF
jgi:hypothetical protein